MRNIILRNVFICILCVLVFRIAYISLIKGDSYAKEAIMQRSENVTVKNIRGIIYDKNMIPLTEGNNSFRVAVIPKECEDTSLVSKLIGREIVGDDINVFTLNSITDSQVSLLDMKGVVVFNVNNRYNSNGLLSHIIGYTSDKEGFGIEYAFDKELIIHESTSISLVKDAHSNAIKGFGYKKNEYKTYKGVKLSIDYHIQQIVENAMDNAQINGATVLVDVKSGDIIAMASRPNFKQDNIAKYLNSSNGELINRAISAYDIGSVFKIVMASAALENGYTKQSPFNCTGSVDISGREFFCNNLDGHGKISLQQGLGYSCNSVFYEVGQSLGAKTIAQYARNFGFGEKVLNINGITESKGTVNIGKSPQDIANMSIGQGSLQATPLQIADMLCTVANDGVRKQLTLVKSMVGSDGIAKDMESVDIGRVISIDTAKTIKSMLVYAVNYGTGTNAKISNWGAGGKTGSAQTGWVRDGETMTHGWFAGFFPAENPKYVCVVVAENGHVGGKSAAPVFKEIGENIRKISQ